MAVLLAGLILFFGVHAISIISETWRDRMAGKIGELPWKGLYGMIALVGLVLLIHGYDMTRASSGIVYTPAPWLRHLVMVLMLPVFPLLLAAYLPGRIRRWSRHPMLLATILWAAGHLLVNGRTVDLLLFGAFLVWALADLWSLRSRRHRPTPAAPETRANDLIALFGGLGLYGLFVVRLHELLIGVPI